MTQHVLIIRLSAIGDVAMAVPVVYSVARQYPDVRFTVLSKPFARPFFDSLAPNVFFMAADIKGEYSGIRGLNKLYRRLVAKNFTAIADLHDMLRSKYLRLRFNLTFAGRPKTAHIDKHRKWRRELCSEKDKVMRQLPTSFDNYLEVLSRLGFPATLTFKNFFQSTTAGAATDGKGNLTKLPSPFNTKPAGEKWLGIAPFAAHQWKVYPTEMMHEVIAGLVKKDKNLHIYLFGGGKEEMAVFDAWCKEFSQCSNASAALGGLSNELILMSHLDVMLSMDSGNMHMAAIAGCPVVSVWGATHPYAGFAPWGQSQDDVIGVDLPCRPCSIYGNKPCSRGDFACMRSIAPEAIISKLSKYI